jgi:hypothetical protein
MEGPPVTVVVAHDDGCVITRRTPLGGHTDAAKRVSDTARLHVLAHGQAAIGRWFACRLEDGSSDNTLYDSKRDAVRHQHHNEQYYAFLAISPGDITVCMAEEFMAQARLLYLRNIRLADPDDLHGGRQVIDRVTAEDQRSMFRSIASGGRLRPSGLVYPGE